MRLTNFWETLDQLGDTSLPEVDWRGGHQKEWPFIKPLLKATGKTASSISCPSPSGPNCPRRVVKLEDGRLVAECQDTPTVCKSLDLTTQCVAISKLDRDKFAAMVCKSLGLAPASAKIGPNGVFHVGDRQVAAGRGVPVFALFQGGSQPEKSVVALEALESFASPRLLLVPTNQTLSSDQKTYLGRTGTTYLPFDDALLCEAHVAQASDVVTQLLDRLVTDVRQTIQSNPAGLIWQLPADAKWEEMTVRFTSEEEINVAFRAQTRRFEPSHLSMLDGRTGKASRQWSHLKMLAIGGGTIPVHTQDPVPGYQKQKQLLSDALKRAFGITAEPIPVDGTDYRAAFVIRDDRPKASKGSAVQRNFADDD